MNQHDNTPVVVATRTREDADGVWHETVNELGITVSALVTPSAAWKAKDEANQDAIAAAEQHDPVAARLAAVEAKLGIDPLQAKG